LQEVEFGEADLTGVQFDQCDLNRAVFEQTILEKADFRTARNFTIQPEQNKVNQAKFSVEGLPGLLSHYPIQIE
jgi:uncharacterized protein YjbI with pentapeptide repeats